MTNEITREQRLELLVQEIELIELEVKRLNRQKGKHAEEINRIRMDIKREHFAQLNEGA